MTVSVEDPTSWRPQTFGSRRAHEIRDPVVEPLWDGDRVLVHVGGGVSVGGGVDVGGGVRVVDAAGQPVEALPEIGAAVERAARVERLVLDGYLTPQAARSSEGAMIGELDVPTAGQMMSQMLLGRGGERRRDLADQPPPPVAPGDTLVLVAIDLLAIDDEPLFDVPLLERRRLLDSAIEEADLVRIGLYVRPPIDPWIGSWRSQGFRALAFKDANGRYRPGAVADDWATAQIPKR
jgi:hypothetical protein